MTRSPDNPIAESLGGPRQEAAPSPRSAKAGTFGRWIRDAVAAAEDAVACIVHWQGVSRTIRSLLSRDDTQLKAMGLERNEVVARVFQDARARRVQARRVQARRARRNIR